MKIDRWLAAFLLILTAAGAFGAIDVHDFEDAATRERYQHLIAELRCPKCQNQSLSGSDAPIAQDLRRELARMLDEGRSDAEIVDFMVQRYGDFVLYRPPLKPETLVLWGAPLAMLLAGAGVVISLVRRQRRLPGADAPLSASEQAEASRLLSAVHSDDQSDDQTENRTDTNRERNS